MQNPYSLRFLTLMLIALVIGLAVTACGGKASGPEEAASAWWEAMAKQDRDGLAELTCADKRPELESAMNMMGIWTKLFPTALGGLFGIDGGSVEVSASGLNTKVLSEQSATAQVRVSGRLRSTLLGVSATQNFTYSLQMLKEGGKWVVCDEVVDDIVNRITGADQLGLTLPSLELPALNGSGSSAAQAAAGNQQEPIPTPVPLTQFVPIEIRANDTGDGWKDYEVKLAVTNDSDVAIEPCEFMQVDWAGRATATVRTEEGYQYPAAFNPYCKTVPAHLNVTGRLDQFYKPEPMTLTFRSASAAHPVSATGVGFEDIDLSEEIKLEFPTALSDENFTQVGSSVTVPGKGTLTLSNPRLEWGSLAASSDWAVTIDAELANSEAGYESKIALKCRLFDMRGMESWKAPHSETGHLVTAGPGQTKKSVLALFARADNPPQSDRVLASLKNAKFWCAGDGVEFTVPLSDKLPVVPKSD